MTDKEICGAETSSGGKCQNPAKSCPWHDENGERTDVETGRKGKYNEETVEAIVEAAKEGLPLRSCARAGNIDESTFYAWMDEKEEFSERVKEARTKAEMKLAKQARKKDPRYILTRSFNWDKPSADTQVNVNNRLAQKQSQGLKVNLQKNVVAARESEESEEKEQDSE